MVELSSDGLSVKGSSRRVFQPWPIPKDWVVECDCLEAPKLTFRDGFYYLTVAEGGSAGPSTSHMVVSARSRNIDGPWEFSPFNPIIRAPRSAKSTSEIPENKGIRPASGAMAVTRRGNAAPSAKLAADVNAA